MLSQNPIKFLQHYWDLIIFQAILYQIYDNLIHACTPISYEVGRDNKTPHIFNLTNLTSLHSLDFSYFPFSKRPQYRRMCYEDDELPQPTSDDRPHMPYEFDSFWTTYHQNKKVRTSAKYWQNKMASGTKLLQKHWLSSSVDLEQCAAEWTIHKSILVRTTN